MNTHLDEGTLQSWLDRELGPDARDAVDRHLDACMRCRGTLEDLRALEPRVRRALADLDEVPRDPGAVLWELRRRRAASRARAHRRRLTAAASILLLVGAGIAAASPGSPIRDWWDGRAAPEEPPVPALDEAPAVATDRAAVSVRPGPEGIIVSLTSLAPGSELEVSVREGERATLNAPAGIRFETGTGRVGADATDAGPGSVRVELPARGQAELRVDGEPWVIVTGGEIRLPGPTAREVRDGSVRFHIPADGGGNGDPDGTSSGGDG